MASSTSRVRKRGRSERSPSVWLPHSAWHRRSSRTRFATTATSLPTRPAWSGCSAGTTIPSVTVCARSARRSWRGDWHQRTDMPDFDYQWANLPSANIEYQPVRIKEFLEHVKLDATFFSGKRCLDCGCGNGRWTWAMQQLGAEVASLDISPEAVAACRRVNVS